MDRNSSTPLLSLASTKSTATLTTSQTPLDTSDTVDILFVSLYVVAGAILLPGLAGNGLITLAVIKIRKLHTPTNYLLASLAVSDLMMMVTMVGFLCYVPLPTIVISANVNAYLFPSFDILVGSASIMNLMAVSIDRAIAVTYPLRYESIVTPERVHSSIRLIWLYAMLMFVFAMLRIEINMKAYQDGFIYTAYALSFFFPFLVMLCCYSLIIFSAINSLKVTRGLEMAVLSCYTDKQVKEKFKRKQRKRELKTAMALTVILFPFVCGWGFYFGVHVYELIADKIMSNQIQDWFMYVIPWLNSSLNPVIYILLNRPLRRCCKKLICGRCMKSKSIETSLASKTALTRLGSKRCSLEGKSYHRDILDC